MPSQPWSQHLGAGQRRLRVVVGRWSPWYNARFYYGICSSPTAGGEGRRGGGRPSQNGLSGAGFRV